MTERERERRIRRIAVALSSERSDAPVLETIAQLASEMAAEITGVFVEDVDLLRLAQLPFAREVSLLTSAERPLESAELERQLRVQAAAVQRALASSAERAGVSWTFSVRRGPFATQLLEATLDVDLTVLGASRRELPHGELHARTRIAWQSAAARNPVVIVYDGSDASARALKIAVRLARGSARPLTVLLAVRRVEEVEAVRARAQAFLGGEPALYRRIPGSELHDVLRAARGESAGILVLGAGEALLAPEIIKQLREELPCAALLVR
ncbi:MAG: universal stress protein [Gammaproteobacteria bacterium]|nr:universal stress protein [Gammaproteobacteria bacterium]NIR83974.1 universal stress protein [Gammaproteobacteria bacterium]NIR89118.1 universal stress protein [Gammaproteobacteria bacterium]NIU04920.1 universal stress protein [Gammaproteobacteria bacterium]NIV52086.1 hypothetical protein [Gammaproteobacteria bacterium]